MNHAVATVISRVFDPFIMLGIFLALTFVRGGVGGLYVWISAFILMIAAPALCIFWAIKRHIVDNWDISKRSQRPLVLVVLLIIESISVAVLAEFVSAWVTYMLLLVLGVLLGFAIVTLRWKMSGHALASALTTGVIVAWYGVSWWPVLLVVPIVAWARVVRRDHTIGQVIVGALYSWVVVAASSLFL